MSEQNRILQAAMQLCAEQGWRSLRIADIAEKSGYSDADLRTIFPDKNAILRYFYDHLESQSLALAEDMPEDTVRDRLFAMMMERIDLASPYRDAIMAMHQEGMPKMTLCRVKSWLRKLGIAAGTNQTTGIKALNTIALGAIWAMVIPVWFKDDSPDLSRTMATLDGQLSNAESLWQKIRSYIPSSMV